MGKIFDIWYIPKVFGEVLSALPVTIIITIIAFGFGLLVGFFSAVVRIYKIPVLDRVVAFYTSFIRGTPLLVQIYLSYYGLPIILEMANHAFHFNMDVSNIPAIYFVFFAYSINTGAYLTETIRGAIEAVDKGQWEAARSIAMTNFQMFRHIIIPQAFLVALPNLGNAAISLIKDTSLAFTITVIEIMGKSKIVAARNYRFFEVYIVAAIIYWLICIFFETLVKYAEKHLKKGRGMEI